MRPCFFKAEHNEALWRHDPSKITHRDFNLPLSKNLKSANKNAASRAHFVRSPAGIDARACRMMPIHTSVFFVVIFVSGASATCMPTAACSTRGSWAASVNTTPRGQTAAAARSTTTEEPGAWVPTSPSPKEQRIYVSIATNRHAAITQHL